MEYIQYTLLRLFPFHLDTLFQLLEGHIPVQLQSGPTLYLSHPPSSPLYPETLYSRLHAMQSTQPAISAMSLGNVAPFVRGSLHLKLLTDHLFLVVFCLVWIRGWTDLVELGNGVIEASQFHLHARK